MFIIKDHRRRAARAVVVVVEVAVFLALLLASSLICYGAYGDSPARGLKEEEVKRGENIVAKLRLLEQLTAASPDYKTYKALMNKLYPDLFTQASKLDDSDLKTDLTTAVFLYDEALQRYDESGPPVSFCRDELRAVYADLCADTHNNSISKLLWARARLHTSWAAAVVDYNRGGKSNETLAALEEMQHERSFDLTLAGRALESLKALGREVCAYPSLREFEAHGSLAKVSFTQLSKEMADMLPAVERILRSLPRSPLFYALYRAHNSYLDGLFWWRKTYRQKEMVVSADSFAEPDEMKSSQLDANVVNYTVAINWRKAISHTREAANIIEALRAGRN